MARKSEFDYVYRKFQEAQDRDKDEFSELYDEDFIESAQIVDNESNKDNENNADNENYADDIDNEELYEEESSEEAFNRLLKESNEEPTFSTHNLELLYKDVLKGKSVINFEAGLLLLEDIFHIRLDDWQKQLLAAAFASEEGYVFSEDEKVKELFEINGKLGALPVGIPNINFNRKGYREAFEEEELCTHGELFDYLGRVRHIKRVIQGRWSVLDNAIEDYFESLKKNYLKFSSFSFIIPRRNGKSYLLAAYLLLNALAGKNCLYSSYTSPSANELKSLLTSIIKKSKAGHLFTLPADSAKGVVKIVFRFKDIESNIHIATRSGSVRGFGVDKIVFDEANDLSSKDIAVYSPLIGNSEEPQSIFCGTPSSLDSQGFGVEMAFNAQVASNKVSPAGFHAEWASPKIVSREEAYQEKVLRRFNPAYGKRLKKEGFLSSLGDLLTFSVERLGYNFTAKEVNGNYFQKEVYDTTSISARKMEAFASTLPYYNISIHCDRDSSFFVIVLCAENKNEEFKPEGLDNKFNSYIFDILCFASIDDENFDEVMTSTIEKYARQNRCRRVIVSDYASTQSKRLLSSIGLFYPRSTKEYKRTSVGKIEFVQRTAKNALWDSLLQAYKRKGVSFLKSDSIRRELQLVYPKKDNSGRTGGINSKNLWFEVALQGFAYSLAPFTLGVKANKY